MSVWSEALLKQASRVRLLGLDVDGVLTDGRLTYGPEGEQLKTFHVHDGLGMRLAAESGITVAVVTARRSDALAARMRDLRIRHFIPGCEDKLAAFSALASELQLALSECAFVGDDLIDLPVMRAVGFAASVANAHFSVRAEAHFVTQTRGGEGAVREVTDLLLESRVGLAAATETFLARKIAAGPKETLQ